MRWSWSVGRISLYTFLLVISLCFSLAANAAPPVRIAVVPAGGSGMEQDAVDRISNALSELSDVSISTVNPDWYVVCNIQEHIDQVSGQIRYNGTVTVKTTDGQVISNVAVQKYNQDFSLSPGAPLNKKLVDSAARDVISGMSERIVGPLQQAVQVEMETRDRMIQATSLGDQDKYDDAIALLRPISPETPHFAGVRKLIADLQMEEQAYNLVNSAEARAKQGKFSEAIKLLRSVPKQSKRYALAKSKIQAYSQGHGPTLVRNNSPKLTSSAAAGGNASAQVKALEAQKRALDAQRKAIDAQEAALKSKEAK